MDAIAAWKHGVAGWVHWAAAERRGDAHWPRMLLVGRGEDEHEEAGRGDEHETTTEALHVRLVA